MSATDPKPGDTLPDLAGARMSRARLALFAGASHDHTDIHIDIDRAREAGHDDVIAQGMLVMAEMARVVTGWAPRERLLGLRCRFLGIVHVGETLNYSGKVETVDDRVIHVTLSGVTEDGRQVVSGAATVARA